jgi:hypothetical protein
MLIGQLSGTSMASPYIAGCIALLKSIDRFLTPSKAKTILQTTAQPVQNENDTFYSVARQGAGLINMQRAVRTLIIRDFAREIPATFNSSKKCNLRLITRKAANIPGYEKRLVFFEPVRLDSHSGVDLRNYKRFLKGGVTGERLSILWQSKIPVLVSGAG